MRVLKCPWECASECVSISFLSLPCERCLPHQRGSTSLCLGIFEHDSWTSLCLWPWPMTHPASPRKCPAFYYSGRPVCVLHSFVQFLPGEGDSGRGDRPERPCGSGVVPEPESQGNLLPTFTCLCLASISQQQQVDPGLAVRLSKLNYWTE